MFPLRREFMRLGFVLALASLLLPRLAAAACSGADCFAGGGPSATACIQTWRGRSGPGETQGDGSRCGEGGRAGGVCALPRSACRGDSSCGVTGGVTSAKVTPAKMAAATALQGAIQGLAPDQCTTPGFTVPVKLSAQLGPIKPGVDKMRAVVSAGGKKDSDVIKMTCQPPSPSFAADIQPILSQRCTQGACHNADFASESLNLSERVAYSSLG